jgi:hypothetical protein
MKGAKINVFSHENFSPLHYASGCLNAIPNTEVILYLISIGVNPDILDINNKTFFDHLLENEKNKDQIINLINNINLTINLRNCLILNKKTLEEIGYNVSNIITETDEYQSINPMCCISHSELESGDKYFKCNHNHCFDKSYLLEWYQQSKKYVCPLCFSVIDLSQVYCIL